MTTGSIIHWYKQTSFTDPVFEQRVTLNRGKFVRFHHDQIGKVERIFTYRDPGGDARIFLRVIDTVSHPCGQLDPITGCPIRQLVAMEARIIGLPASHSKRLYTIPIAMDDVSGAMEEQADSSDLLHVDWNIQFI
ncbi:hypothetical protein K470DRAFT_268274 [Piedraia hortae CBS 480.64]|uniref:Uncharacterized protein n=1 Tax=Piedraia hortae CBS 480.64 TaxID=1314780 RepID=A0A6A7C7M8_9PEZI|nr:hypothetical protein K470DRAFT_268274 [Piedraia hortae CBS 480.64]